jgi:type IV pilus assembly protein PilA
MAIKTKSVKGFTLLEIILVVGVIAIIAGIVVLAINPTKQLGDSRNAQRRSDVLTILNAVNQYYVDHNSALIDLNGGQGLTGDATDNCGAGDTEAYRGLAASLIGASSTYLMAIPFDPANGTANSNSDYYVHLNSSSKRITVCAPDAENGAIIKVTR